MRFNDFVQARIGFHTLTYWNALAQFIVFSLAIVWLTRNLMHRGFWHTASVAVKTTSA